jgi:galactokinase
MNGLTVIENPPTSSTRVPVQRLAPARVNEVPEKAPSAVAAAGIRLTGTGGGGCLPTLVGTLAADQQVTHVTRGQYNHAPLAR